MNREHQCQTVKEIMDSCSGVELKEKKGGSFQFRMYLTHEMKETGIEALDLSNRSENSLKRAGYYTIGKLADAVSGGVKLRDLRNCGVKSAIEIMEHMFLYQYYLLSPEQRDDYLDEVVTLNSYAQRKK